MDKLKPCPFCGGEAAFLGETQSIKCKQCGGMFIVTNPLTTRLEAKEAWNRRVNDASVVHGEWSDAGFVELPKHAPYGWVCSVCGGISFNDEYIHCPGCGALMDGGEDRAVG